MSEATEKYRREEEQVHVPLERLDHLLNLVGDLVICRAQLAESGRNARIQHGFKEQVLDLVETIEHVGRVVDDIQERVIKSRMVPVEQVFDRFTPFIQDLSGKQDKEIRLHILGRTTEIDKKIIDALSEPLVHLVRNAIDHGLETSTERVNNQKNPVGTVTLGALHKGNHLVITVQDDGKGIDPEAIRNAAIERGALNAAQADQLSDAEVIELLFSPSFSTSATVTDLSGRGVGLDAAREHVETLGGTLSVESTPGLGSSFQIRLPITMAIIPALLVRTGGEDYAIPLDHVEETLRTRQNALSTVEGALVLERRGEALPVERLSTVLDVADAKTPDNFYTVVIRGKQSLVGIAVDQVLGSQDIVVKPLTGQLTGLDIFSGAAIAADGSVFLALDAEHLGRTLVNDGHHAQEQRDAR